MYKLVTRVNTVFVYLEVAKKVDLKAPITRKKICIICLVIDVN